ncbi:unnamed protein product [Clonostachys chloroleuca]|uniref:Heterokaryon incompatibility domain-containing protein n=1 Tax=Clonostachys chloroleuca TaxID=1926264 RepID=A0AA35M220_9HYPO|nr:unnamed protein product [Clonostachys chloroleuca]
MEATKTYKYTALSGPRIIRVLRLSGGSTDNLFAELVETNLDHACSYEAISYVWGSAEKSHTLNLRGGSPVKITESLYHALKDIRYSTIEDGPRYLWADGACINQEDIDERSQQVGLMAEIYGSALKVITYVGQDTLDVKKGMKLAETLVAAQKESRRSSANKSNAKHRIPGCVFDRVVHVGGTLRRCFITARLERYKWAQEQYSQLLTRSGTKYVGGGASLEAFWRTLILDLDPEKRMQHHNALRTSGASFESYVRPNKLWARKEALESIEDYNPNKRPKPPAIESVVMEAWKRESMLDPTACDKDEGEYNVFRSLRQKDSQQGSSSQGLEYRDLVLKAQNLYRAFFMTEKGYIGMSAQGVELDDVVTFLPGARVPFLLRRKKECSTYSLVGDCYIHGMMNGEVLRDGHWNVSPIILV